MASETDIANMALMHLGVGARISNLDTDRTTNAATLREFYSTARDQVLRDFAWPFATKVQSLALVEEEPNDEWAYSYRYPTDCLRLHRILSGAARVDSRDTAVPYRFASDDSGELIYTDKDEAVAEWTTRIEDVNRYPSDFRIALSYLLAALVAPALAAGDPARLGTRALQLYEIQIARAAANAANEEVADPAPESSFIRARD